MEGGLGTLAVMPGIGLLILSTSNRFIHLSNIVASRPNEPGVRKHLQHRGRLLHRSLVALYVTLAGVVGAAFVQQIPFTGTALAVQILWPTSLACLAAAAFGLVRESALAREMLQWGFGPGAKPAGAPKEIR